MRLHSARYWYRRFMMPVLSIAVLLAIFVSPWFWALFIVDGLGVLGGDQLLRPE